MSLPESPLAPCPGTPNCERESRAFRAHAPAALFEKAQDALGEMGPAELAVRDGEQRVDAVFRVALIFKDDVAVAVEPHGNEESGAGGAVLHIRSASRVGAGDLGVNARRVERFFRTLDSSL
jgi:uncharacterized protein (DUF1499 family)